MDHKCKVCGRVIADTGNEDRLYTLLSLHVKQEHASYTTNIHSFYDVLKVNKPDEYHEG